MFCNTWIEAFKRYNNYEKIFKMQLPNGLLRVKFKACTKSDIQLHFFLLRSFFKPQINPTAGGFIESSAYERSQCLLAWK